MNWFGYSDKYNSVPAYVVHLDQIDRSHNFSVTWGDWIIVESSPQPTLAAARAMHEIGCPDYYYLISIFSAEVFAVGHGTIGVLRRLRIREDSKYGRHFAMSKPWPTSDVARRKRESEIRAGADYYNLSLEWER